MMRPIIFFEEIRHHPVWTRKDALSVARIMDVLEKNVDTFKQELHSVRDGRHFQAVHGHVVSGGTWSRHSIYSDKSWSDVLCEVTPRTCDLFRNELPGLQAGLPYAVQNHEEVSFFHMSPNSRILPHSGLLNGRINLHIGLEGCHSSELRVYTGIGVNDTRTLLWRDHEAFAFNDGWTREIVTGS